MDAVLVQFVGNPDLVFHQKGDIFRLRAVAQGGIVQFYQAHAVTSSTVELESNSVKCISTI